MQIMTQEIMGFEFGTEEYAIHQLKSHKVNSGDISRFSNHTGITVML